jgi:hypothetical protein
MTNCRKRCNLWKCQMAEPPCYPVFVHLPRWSTEPEATRRSPGPPDPVNAETKIRHGLVSLLQVERMTTDPKDLAGPGESPWRAWFHEVIIA